MAKPLTIQTIFSAIDKMSGPIKTMRGNTFKFSKETQDAFKQVGNFAKRAGQVMLGGAALLGKGLYDFAQRGDDIARNAQILGLSTDAYQELSQAAKMADVDQEAFAAATKKLSKNVADLRIKQGTLYDTLAKTNPALAFQLRDAKSTDEAFMDVAAAIAKETNVQKKAQLAMAAYGKTGQELIPMMDDLTAARGRAREEGALMTKEQIAAASALDTSLKRIKIMGTGLINSVLGPLADKLAPIVEKMTKWLEVNKNLVASKISDVITAVGKGIDFLIQPGVLKGMAALAVGIKAISIASAMLGASNPLVLVLGAIAAAITFIIANWDKIEAFFDKLSGGQAHFAADPTGKAPRDIMGYSGGMVVPPKGSSASPASPTPATTSMSYSETMSRYSVDWGTPPPGVSIRQSKPVDTGRQMAGGAH